MSEKMDTESKQKCSKSKRKSLGSYCTAINGHNSRGNCTLSMFRFPKDEERCKKWVQHVRREDLRHTPLNKLCHFQLCSNHFEDSQFMNRNTKSGLDTMVLICDQGTNNRLFLQTLEKVSIEKPYIVYNNKRVFVIYDPPHLLKNVWNNFMKSNYKYDDVEVRWQYIVDFYNRDKTMSIKMAPKLTDRIIILPPFPAMRVNLAAQTLSHSVAAGINKLCTLNYLPDDASVTAYSERIGRIYYFIHLTLTLTQ